MPPPAFELRELFHLTLLRHLGTRLSGRSYAVKGGICLRFFHRSARMSEDMDLDVVSNVRIETLRNAVDSVLGGQALLSSLMPARVLQLTATKPKQTETTQRWKVHLHLAGDETLPTRLEFSRRKDRIAFTAGVPDAELLRRHRLPPFAAQFYSAPAMAAQKVAALAAPARNALRDLFDLHHLLITLGVKPEDVAGEVTPAQVSAAAAKVASFSFRDFAEQVRPYLTEELIGLYQDPAAFERQKEEVERGLAGMLK